TMPVRVVSDLGDIVRLEHAQKTRQPLLAHRTTTRHAHLAPANALPRGTPCLDAFEVATNSAGRDHEHHAPVQALTASRAAPLGIGTPGPFGLGWSVPNGDQPYRGRVGRKDLGLQVRLAE